MVNKEEILNFRIFEGFAPEDIDALLGISQKISFLADDIILEESSYGADSDFYIILKGNVKIELQARQTHTENPISKRLTVLQASDIFGEMSLLKNSRRSAQVSAYSDLIVLKVKKEKLFELFVYNPRLGYLFMRNLAAILADRIRDMNFMWRDDI